MRLHRHDDIMLAIATALRKSETFEINGDEQDVATAALETLLTAVVEMGVGEVSDVEFTGDAHTQAALFIRLEEKQP